MYKTSYQLDDISLWIGLGSLYREKEGGIQPHDNKRHCEMTH